MQPALFGIKYANRDFTKPEGWSKNNFNSAFPASLCCYMDSQNLQPIYLNIDAQTQLQHSSIHVAQLFGISPHEETLYYAFEQPFSPYQPLVVGNLPRIDLVLMDKLSGASLRGLEIKLTALPDNSTAHLSDDGYGTELVIRPDTIVYLALSIVDLFKNKTNELASYLPMTALNKIDWVDSNAILAILPEFLDSMNSLMTDYHNQQIPLIMQPIWKTQGKRLVLDEHAFDVFIWSNFATTQLFFYAMKQAQKQINRQTRAIVWLMKMLFDFVRYGQIDYEQVIDELSLSTKNDKAFSVSGRVTHRLMACAELVKPRIRKDAIRDIILGEGQKLLSPERRLDAVIMSMAELFED